jgi:hypothetical protein
MVDDQKLGNTNFSERNTKALNLSRPENGRMGRPIVGEAILQDDAPRAAFF